MAGKYVHRQGRTGRRAASLAGWLAGVALLLAGLWGGGSPSAVGLAAESAAGVAAATSPVSAATVVLPNGLSDPGIYDAVRTLAEAGVFQFQPGEEWLGQWPVSRDEMAIWLHRLLQRLGVSPATLNPTQELPPAAQAQLKAWVAQEVAAALAALPPVVAPAQHVVEREVVVQAGPHPDEMKQIAQQQAEAAVAGVMAQAEKAAAQAAQALADAAQAQAQAAASLQQDQQLQERLLATSQELYAAQQAVSVLQQRVAQLEQVQGSLEAVMGQLSSLSGQLQELQAALAQSDQRLTALDLRSASAQADLETLRTLIDQRAQALAQQMGVDKQQFQRELQAARDRLATIEKDYVRQEALAAVQALVNTRTAQLEEALATLTATVRPELLALEQRLTTVEKRTQDQGERLIQLEQRLSTPVQLTLEWQGQQVSGDAAGEAAAAAAGRMTGNLLWQSVRAQVRGPGAARTNLTWMQQTGAALPGTWQELELAIPLGGQLEEMGTTGAEAALGGGSSQLQALAGIEGVPSLPGAGTSVTAAETALYWKTGVRYQVGSGQSQLGLQLQTGVGGPVAPAWWQAQADLAAGPLQLRGWWGGGRRGTWQLFPTPLTVGLPSARGEAGFSGQLCVPVGGRGKLGVGLGWLGWPTPESGSGGVGQREGWLALTWPVGSQAWLALQGRRWWGGGDSAAWQANAVGLTMGLSF